MQSNTPEKYSHLVFDACVGLWGEWFGLNSSKPLTSTTPHMRQHPCQRYKMGIFFGGD